MHIETPYGINMILFNTCSTLSYC